LAREWFSAGRGTECCCSRIPILADEVYSDVSFGGPSPLYGSLAPDAPIISFSPK
jgi:hypothetical protein